MAQTQDPQNLSHLTDMIEAMINNPSLQFAIEARIQLAQAEQTSRLADAVEALVKWAESITRPDKEEGDKKEIHVRRD